MKGKASKGNYGNFFRFLVYVKPYTFIMILAIIGGVAKFTIPLFVPQVTRHLLDNVLMNAVLTSAQKYRELFISVGGLIVLYIFGFAPVTYARSYFAGKAGHRSVFDLRCDLYEKIIRMSASFFGRNRSGEIVSRLISDIPMAQNLVGNALTSIWMDAAAIVFILYFLIKIDIATTLVALVTFPFYLFFFRKFGHEIKKTSSRVQKETAYISGNVNEKISGSMVVHAFTQEGFEKDVFSRDSEKLFTTTMRNVSVQAANMTLTATLTGIAPLIVLIFGGWRLINGHLTIGELIAITMYLNPLYLPLQRFAELNVIFANSMAALNRIFEILDQKPEIADAPEAIESPPIEGSVEFTNVHFSYIKGEPVLRDINFSVRPGSKVALVGPSGSGKSTIASLIPRFYDIDSGCIKIDGRDIRGLKVKSLRNHIGMVLQDPILFSGSIFENIQYGNPQASREEVLEASRAANAFEFVCKLPAGFDTSTGERGMFLSGGQKQRLTIARAFLRNPRILVLDEATSALDSESERLIQDALSRLMTGRTTFIIAHRLSTIVNADLILVLNNGSIVESGNHNELLACNGLYAALYNRQFESAH